MASQSIDESAPTGSTQNAGNSTAANSNSIAEGVNDMNSQKNPTPPSESMKALVNQAKKHAAKAPLKPKAGQLSTPLVTVNKTGHKAKMGPPKKVTKKATPAAPAPGDLQVVKGKTISADDAAKHGGRGDGSNNIMANMPITQACLVDLLKSTNKTAVAHQIAEKAPKKPKGLAKTLIDQFPRADCYAPTQARELGTAIIKRATMESTCWIVALVAQKYIGKPNDSDDTEVLRNKWLVSAVEDARDWINENSSYLNCIYFPEKIGAGLAGGNKNTNQALVERVRSAVPAKLSWCWVREPDLVTKHEEITNKSQNNTSAAETEQDPEGDDFSVDQLLLQEALEEADDQDHAVIPEVPACPDGDQQENDQVANPDQNKFNKEDKGNKNLSSTTTSLKNESAWELAWKQAETATNVSKNRSNTQSQSDLKDDPVLIASGNKDAAQNSKNISLEQFVDLHGNTTENQSKELPDQRQPGGSSFQEPKTKAAGPGSKTKDVKVRNRSNPKKDSKNVSFDISANPLINGKKDPEDSKNLSMSNRADNEDNKSKLSIAEINRMVENFRMSLQAQATADTSEPLTAEEATKRAELAHRYKNEEKVGTNRYTTLHDDLPADNREIHIAEESEDEPWQNIMTKKLPKTVIRVPAAPMPGAWGNQNTHRGNAGDHPNIDPYGNVSFIVGKKELLPEYNRVSVADITYELSRGSMSRIDTSIVAKGPLTDIVWLYTQNESLRLHMLKLPMGNDKTLNPLITRAGSREILSIVHDMELYAGDGFTVNADIRELRKTKDTEDWFVNAALPMMRSAMINATTRQAAYNLKIAADACRFGRVWIDQKKIDKFWQDMVPDPSTESLNTESAYAMYAVLSCLASGCSPRVMGRKIFLSKIKKDKEWKSIADKWDVKVVDEDSASDYKQHPLIPTSALKTICDSMAAKTKKVTKLDNIAGIPLQDHSKLVIEMAVKKIINTMQYESLLDSDISSANPTAASFDKSAATQLVNKLGLFAAYLLITATIFKDMDNHDVIISVKNSFASSPFFRLQEAKEKTKIAALQIMVYVTRDHVKAAKFTNWTCTNERNNTLRDCISQAKKLLLDHGIICQTDYDKLPESKFIIKDEPGGDADKSGLDKKNKKKKAKKEESDEENSDSNDKKKKSDKRWLKKSWKDWSDKSYRSNSKYNSWGNSWSWDRKDQNNSWDNKDNKRKWDNDDNSPSAKRQKADKTKDDKQKDKSADKTPDKWVMMCAKAYDLLSKDEKKKLATKGIKQGSKPDMLEIPGSVCRKGLLDKCTNKACKRNLCKPFLEICQEIK